MKMNINELIELNNKTKMSEELRLSAWDGNLEVVKLLIDAGADVNYYKRDNIFTSSTTPLHCAASRGHVDVVCYLIEKGADVSIVGEYGFRVYHEAKSNKNEEIMEIIKDIDCDEWYNYESCVRYLNQFNLPKATIEFLGRDNKKVVLEKSDWTKYIVFNSVEDVRVFKWRNMTFVDLLFKVDNYSEIGALSWIPEYNSFACLDIEHDKFGFIKGMTWEEIINDIDKVIDNSLSWEYCEIEEEN